MTIPRTSPVVTVDCPKCGTAVEMSQPNDHSEYTPSGCCPSCGVVVMLDLSMARDGLPDMGIMAFRLGIPFKANVIAFEPTIVV